MRKTYTLKERELILEKLEQSGLSAMQFCRNEGLCYQTLHSWKKKHRQEHADLKAGFVEVCLPQGMETGQRICVRFPTGAEVWFDQVEPGYLARFCRELGVC
jgi:hypothetical protein